MVPEVSGFSVSTGTDHTNKEQLSGFSLNSILMSCTEICGYIAILVNIGQK
jgi:hypothetical protein